MAAVCAGRVDDNEEGVGGGHRGFMMGSWRGRARLWMKGRTSASLLRAMPGCSAASASATSSSNSSYTMFRSSTGTSCGTKAVSA